jgi:mRNA-degrading endonuclease RelE of RelBE toxin-antitoxin system
MYLNIHKTPSTTNKVKVQIAKKYIDKGYSLNKKNQKICDDLIKEFMVMPLIMVIEK